jgi:imidazolonepropionase-like amidohydrolase
MSRLASTASWIALAAWPALALAEPSQEKSEQRSWTVFAERVYTGAGEPVKDGSISVRDGKLGGISGNSSASSGDHALNCAAITPGMIDMSVRIDLGWWSVEQSREVTPEARVSQALDLFDETWPLIARSGVTTVLCAPPPDNVLGGLGVVLKTAGDSALAGRTVKADAALRGAIGSQPSSRNHPAFGRPDDFYSRRPTTRMGVEWELRHAFYDAAAARKDSEEAGEGTQVLLSVLDGKVPLFLQAWTTQDIRTAVFLKEEIEREGLGHARLIVDAAAEAWKEPQLLARSGAAVVLPPFPATGRTGEASFMAWNTAKLLVDLGVPVALSSHGAQEAERRLDRQAGYAMRGGLSFDAALAAVTSTPAKLLGVDQRVGTLEAGKDADLVMWSGTPFEPTSRVIGVLIDGRLVLDPRESSATTNK